MPGLRNIMGADVFASPSQNDLQPDPPEPKPAIVPEKSPPSEPVSGTEGGATNEALAAPSASSQPPLADPIHLVTRPRIVDRADGTNLLQISGAAATMNVPLNRNQIIHLTRGIMMALERSEWALD
ncbi:MAG: hypothetical protein CMM26_06820 [Rhodospirillaceae bacterium]|nr:hypothetical protein [Rhodospirillaceae bacterium]